MAIREISEPGAALQVFALELTEEQRAGLTLGPEAAEAFRAIVVPDWRGEKADGE